METRGASFQDLVPAGGGDSTDSGPGQSGRPDIPPLHPRGVGQMLDAGLDVLRDRFGTCVLMTFFLFLPAQALMRLPIYGSAESEAAGMVAGMILSQLLNSICIGLVSLVVLGELKGERVGAADALRVGLRRAPKLFLCSLIIGIGTGVGTMCCFAPGVYLMFIWSVAPSVLILENTGPIAALVRSKNLVQQSFWRWAGLWSVLILLSAPFSGVAGLLGEPELRSDIQASSASVTCRSRSSTS